MRRRDFVIRGLWLAAGSAVPFGFFEGVLRAAAANAAVGCAATASMATARTDAAAFAFSMPLAVFDAVLAPSVEFARRMRDAGVPLFDVEDDIGTLWHTTLAPRLLAATGGSIGAHAESAAAASSTVLLLGLIRASDHFVLQRLARAPQVAWRSNDEATGAVNIESTANCHNPFNLSNRNSQHGLADSAVAFTLTRSETADKDRDNDKNEDGREANPKTAHQNQYR